MSALELMAMVRHGLVAFCATTIVVLAAYVSFDLAERSRQSMDRFGARLWIGAGAAAMGTGVWSMHFVGMSAVDYPFKAGFDFSPTFLSWAMAVALCLVPVGLVASPARRNQAALWRCACAAGVGGVAMHLVGASAMATLPATIFDPTWLAAALACAVAGAAIGLPRVGYGGRRQAQAALIVGGGLAGMHFLAMRAASFEPGAICIARGGIEAHALSRIVGAMTLAFLGMMLLMSSLEKRSQRMSAAVHRSLALARDEVQRASLVDPVTGLPNRLVFQQALERAARPTGDGAAGTFAVLMVEIDGFARASRNCRPELAHAALRAIGSRLAAVGPDCQLASAGAHQYLMLAAFSEADSETATRIAARVASGMRPPLDFGTEMRLTASIGISLHPADGPWERAVGNAAVAMEAAKSRGGNGYAFFEAGMDSHAHAATALVDDLRIAVERGQLELHYQPKVHAASGQIAGVEALLRWRHPNRGMVGPVLFIPLAERFGLINELGSWVVSEAARQMAAWAEDGLRLRVAVNVSPGQLIQPGFADSVVAEMARAGVSAELLTCEITESGAMQDTNATMAAFERLNSAGIQLSIDDFGTGYSSLSHLRRIPLRQLKVDRSFVNDLEDSLDARSIVAAIIDMAHALRLEVVAEGVETAAQRDILLAMRCDKFQGYLFAKPMPAERLTELMLGVPSAREQFRESIFTA